MQPDGHEKNVEFYAVDAVDKAELCFFILQPDVSSVFSAQRSEIYVQAKLNAITEDDINSNGAGVAESTLVLYNVSEALRDN